MLADVAPLLHIYELPPEAVSVVELPLHTVSLPVIAAVSELPTVTVTVAESTQPPDALVPVTV